MRYSSRRTGDFGGGTTASSSTIRTGSSSSAIASSGIVTWANRCATVRVGHVRQLAAAAAESETTANRAAASLSLIFYSGRLADTQVPQLAISKSSMSASNMRNVRSRRDRLRSARRLLNRRLNQRGKFRIAAILHTRRYRGGTCRPKLAKLSSTTSSSSNFFGKRIGQPSLCGRSHGRCGSRQVATA